MAETTLNMKLLLRRDDVFTSTYVLAKGEPGFEVTTNTLKIGDGTKTWAELPIANKAAIDALIKATDDKLAGYKPLQDVIAAVETSANTFVDTVAQDANGKITITTKAVDFSAADDRFKKLQTAVAAVATEKNVFVEQIAQDAQGVITITTKAVDFSDYRTAAAQDAIDATFALKTDVATEFAKYTTTTAQQAIDAEQDRRIGVLEAKPFGDYATKTEVQEVAGDLSDYETTNDARVKAIEDEIDTFGDIVTHNAAEFETAGAAAAAEGRINTKLEGYYTKTEADAAFTTPAEVIAEVNKALSEVSGTDTIESISTLVNYVNENAADLTGLITEVYGAAEMTGNSRIDELNTKADANLDHINVELTSETGGNIKISSTNATGEVDSFQITGEDIISFGHDASGNIYMGLGETVENRFKALEEAGYATETYVDDAVKGKLDANGWYHDEATGHLQKQGDAGNISLGEGLVAVASKSDAGQSFYMLGNYAGANGLTMMDANGSAAVYGSDKISIRVDNDTNNELAFPEKAGTFALTSDVATAEQNAKDYADGLAGNYATKAQGEKADTAYSWGNHAEAGYAADQEVFYTVDVTEEENVDASDDQVAVVTFKNSEGSEVDSFKIINTRWSPDGATTSMHVTEDGNIRFTSAGYYIEGAHNTDGGYEVKFMTEGDQIGNSAIIPAATSTQTGLVKLGAEGGADVYGAAAQALEDAKAYADGLNHKDTTYTVAATANPLQFTVTPSEGDAQTVTLVAPIVDTGVMKVTAGTDIVVTPEAGTGEVTVAHKEYATGRATLDSTPEEPYFFNALDLENGHVTKAYAQSLKAALEGMSFVFDGGTSTN